MARNFLNTAAHVESPSKSDQCFIYLVGIMSCHSAPHREEHDYENALVAVEKNDEWFHNMFLTIMVNTYLNPTYKFIKHMCNSCVYVRCMNRI